MARGRKTGGRQRGTRNKATVEHEREAELAAERERLLMEARAEEMTREVREAAAGGKKLMKEIGFTLTHVAAGLVAYFEPRYVHGEAGQPMQTNPNYDEQKFRYYLEMAMQGARDFAPYESPRLSATVVGARIMGPNGDLMAVNQWTSPKALREFLAVNNGGGPLIDLSAVSDDDLATLERIVEEIAVAVPGSGGGRPPDQGAGGDGAD